jgi:hypothetical protein
MLLLVAIAWLYVVMMMAAVEAASPNGTLLGAFFTLLLYGVLPLSIALYLLNTPARRARRRTQESAALAASAASARPPAAADASAPDPDERRHAPGDTLTPKGEEP